MEPLYRFSKPLWIAALIAAMWIFRRELTALRNAMRERLAGGTVSVSAVAFSRT